MDAALGLGGGGGFVIILFAVAGRRLDAIGDGGLFEHPDVALLGFVERVGVGKFVEGLLVCGMLLVGFLSCHGFFSPSWIHMQR